MVRTLSVAFVAMLAAAPALAAEPDGLTLPPGFHATVVAEGVGPARHMALRGNDIYVSTRHGNNQPSVGIVALRLGPDHKVLQTGKIAGIDQGTGIRIYKNYLYAANGTGVVRIALDDMLVPAGAPETIVDGLAATNHPIAFDGKGNLFVSIDGGGGANNCPDPNGPKDKPVGLKPCPLLETRGGIWRFDDSKPGQKLAGVKALQAWGATGYLEVGPRATLLGLASASLDGEAPLLPSMQRQKSSAAGAPRSVTRSGALLRPTAPSCSRGPRRRSWSRATKAVVRSQSLPP